MFWDHVAWVYDIFPKSKQGPVHGGRGADLAYRRCAGMRLQTDKGGTNGVSDAIGKAGADFKQEFTLDTYKQFFADVGYTDAGYVLCEGRIPCAVAILTKSEKNRTL